MPRISSVGPFWSQNLQECNVCLFVCLSACMPQLWFARTGPYVTHVEAREEAKTKKPRFRKCGFFVACPYGPLCHPRGGKGKGKNQKTTFWKVWFFRGLPARAPMPPTWRQGKRQKPKNHVLESVVFSWFARTVPYVTHVEAKDEAKTKKPRFRKCGFFVVCPYGPLCHPRRQGKRQKPKKHVLESVVFSWFARTGPYMSPTWRQGKRQKPKNHVLENVVFSWFARTGPYVTHVGAREGAKTKKTHFAHEKTTF